MRALANDGATASRQEPPCTTPDELAKAVAAMPRIRPPELEFPTPPEYQRTTYQQGSYGRPQPPAGPAATQLMGGPPAPLQSRTGRALKWAVSALLIAAIGLASWQVADRLLDQNNKSEPPRTTQPQDQDDEKEVETGKPVQITGAYDFDPLGDGSEKPQGIKNAYDGDPSSFWNTDGYFSADFGRLKKGVGLVLDLGKAQQVGSVDVSFLGTTSVELRTAPADAASAPGAPDAFTTQASGTGGKVTLKPTKPVTTRYVLVWLTKLPASNEGNFRGKITDIKITS